MTKIYKIYHGGEMAKEYFFDSLEKAKAKVEENAKNREDPIIKGFWIKKKNKHRYYLDIIWNNHPLCIYVDSVIEI